MSGHAFPWGATDNTTCRPALSSGRVIPGTPPFFPDVLPFNLISVLWVVSVPPGVFFHTTIVNVVNGVLH